MFVDKKSSELFNTLQSYSRQKIGTLSDAIASQKNEKSLGFSSLTQPTSNMLGMMNTTSMDGLSPVEKYKYMLKQSQSSVDLNTVATDPEKAIENANELIGKASLFPNNVSSESLFEALVVRQQARTRLDISA